ncbi:MAG: methyl-accepting chemotaxis protein [Deltaproteobacteria bacterium]|nr:methyl-accepting chemotaxis protein [Deltaproteobacteria bacterium]
MNWPGRFTLRTKLSALVAGLLALVAAALMAVIPPQVNASAQMWAERRAEAVAIILANAVAPGLDFDDPGHVAAQLAGLERSPGAIYGGVRYSDGRLLASWPTKEIPLPLPMPEVSSGKGVAVARVWVEKGQLRVQIPLTTAGGQRGLVQAGFSTTELARDQHRNRMLVGLLAFGVFITGAAAAFAIGAVLSRPLRRMTDVALLLSAGDIRSAEASLGAREPDAAVDRSHDEVNRLSTSFARMLKTLRHTTSTLQGSSSTLTASVARLSATNADHGAAIQRQAESLQRAQSSAQQIKEASMEAATEAQAVLDVAERADETGRQGEAFIADSLAGLSDIRSQVQEIARKVSGLGERLTEAETITATVRELADQSQLLALNAAIEAARAGDQGRGFAVIARSINELADQSIASTKQIQAVLSELLGAARSVVDATEAGLGRVEGGLTQMQQSSERLREVTVLVRGSAEAVRRIAARVREQDQGIDLLSTSMSELLRQMDFTVERLRGVEDAMQGLDQVVQGVAQATSTFRT